jgi:hypothetical protein
LEGREAVLQAHKLTRVPIPPRCLPEAHHSGDGSFHSGTTEIRQPFDRRLNIARETALAEFQITYRFQFLSGDNRLLLQQRQQAITGRRVWRLHAASSISPSMTSGSSASISSGRSLPFDGM